MSIDYVGSRLITAEPRPLVSRRCRGGGPEPMVVVIQSFTGSQKFLRFRRCLHRLQWWCSAATQTVHRLEQLLLNQPSHPTHPLAAERPPLSTLHHASLALPHPLRFFLHSSTSHPPHHLHSLPQPTGSSSSRNPETACPPHRVEPWSRLCVSLVLVS